MSDYQKRLKQFEVAYDQAFNKLHNNMQVNILDKINQAVTKKTGVPVTSLKELKGDMLEWSPCLQHFSLWESRYLVLENKKFKMF